MPIDSTDTGASDISNLGQIDGPTTGNLPKLGDANGPQQASEPAPQPTEQPQAPPSIGDRLGNAFNAATQGMGAIAQSAAPIGQGIDALGRAEQQGEAADKAETPFQNISILDPLAAGKALVDIGDQQWNMGRRVWKAYSAFAFDTKATSDSIQNIWNELPASAAFHSAYEDARQQAFQQAAQGGPLAGVMTAAATPDVGVKDVAGAEAGALSLGANPLNAMPMLGEGPLAARIGMAAMPGVSQTLLDSNGNDPNQLLWAVMGGAVLGGAPGRAARALLSKMPESMQVEAKLNAVLSSMRTNDQIANRFQLNTDWMDDILKEGPAQGISRLAAAAEAVDPTLIAKKGGTLPSGDIVVKAGQDANQATGGMSGLTRVQQTARNKVYKELGVSSDAEFMKVAEAGGFNPRQTALVAQNWAKMGFTHDLNYVEGERMPVDPHSTLSQLQTESPYLGAAGREALDAAKIYGAHVRAGLASNNVGNPIQAWFRSLIGANSATDFLGGRFHDAMDKLGATLTDAQRGNVGRAIEGDAAAYDKLPTHGKLAADLYTLVGKANRDQGLDAGHLSGFVRNFMPRVPEGGRAPSSMGASPDEGLTGERLRQRSLTLGTMEVPAKSGIPGDTETQVFAHQAYPTVQDANAAVADQRTKWIQDVSNPLSQRGIDSTDTTAQRIRDMALGGDEEGAQKLAEEEALRRYPPFETDPFKVFRQTLTKQTKAIHSKQAVDIAAGDGTTPGIQIETEDANGNTVIAPAMRRMLKNDDGLTDASRWNQENARLGYKPVNSPYFSDVAAHPDMHKLLETATRHADDAYKDGFTGKAWQAFLAAERLAVKSVMYFPMAHGWNMAGRLGWLGMAHPMEMAHALLGEPAEGMSKELAWELDRAEAVRHGMVQTTNRNQSTDYSRGMANLLGDESMHNVPNSVAPTGANPAFLDAAGPLGVKLGPAADATKRAANGVGAGYQWLNNQLWNNVNNFGVLAYRIEKAYAQKQLPGESDGNISRWAANRANSWMGHVAQIDWNPKMQEAARLLTFAPNWWRTYGQLLAPYYSNLGSDFYKNPAVAKMVARNEVQTLLAHVAWQKTTGEALNLMLSGHGQQDNLDGYKDSLEIGPGQMQILKDAAKVTGPVGAWVASQVPDPDPKKGQRLYIDNPFARQQKQLEGALGLESGQSNAIPTSQQVSDGVTKFVAGRFSPFLNATAAGVGNFDLYRSMRDKQMRWYDQNHPGPASFVSNPADLLYAPLMLFAGGSQAESAYQQASRDQANPNQMVKSPIPGLPDMPKGVASVLGSGQAGAVADIMNWLAGVNMPTPGAAKTQGQLPSDAQYAALDAENKKYDAAMNDMSNKMLTGQITPDQWRQWYHDRQQQHRDLLENTFGQAPEYVNGTTGLVNEYENLYQQATDKDGVVDYAKLSQLQEKFRRDHTTADMQAMTAELNKNRQKYPALALYHQTIDSYQSWQTQWAAAHGVDLNTLQRDASQSKLAALDPAAARAFASEHPEYAAFEKAKRSQFDKTQAGLMFRLFYGSTSAVKQAAKQGKTVADVMNEVKGASGGGATGA